jgi:hypothetical protein
MTDLSELLKKIREHNEKYKITENSSPAEKLRGKLSQRGLTNEEYLKLEQEVIDFFKAGVSEADKKILMGYTESLYMICSAIRSNLL